MTGQPTTLRLRLIIPLGSLGRLTLFGSSRKCALGASHCRSPSGSNSSLSPNSGGCTPGWRVPPLRGDDASSPTGTNMPARPEWLGMVAFREHRSLKGSHNRLACYSPLGSRRRVPIGDEHASPARMAGDGCLPRASLPEGEPQSAGVYTTCGAGKTNVYPQRGAL
jgi:hypothetical protein